MAAGDRTAARSCRSRPKMVRIRGGTGGLRRVLGGGIRPPGCPEPLTCSRRYNRFSKQDLCTIFVAFQPVPLSPAELIRRARSLAVSDLDRADAACRQALAYQLRDL